MIKDVKFITVDDDKDFEMGVNLHFEYCDENGGKECLFIPFDVMNEMMKALSNHNKKKSI